MNHKKMKNNIGETRDMSSIVESEEEPKLIANLKGAIKSDDSDSVMDALGELDKYLTGSLNGAFADKPDATRSRVEGEIKEFLEKFGSRASFNRLSIILGDGGYSRLLLVGENDKIDIAITPNASDEVREKWDKME